LEISFKNNRLRDVCQQEVKARKELGDICARKLRARLSELEAASNVTELVAGSPHTLTRDRLGQFAVSLAGGVRLVFEPANNPIPRLNETSVDWSKVTIVSIEYIGDYHD